MFSNKKHILLFIFLIPALSGCKPDVAIPEPSSNVHVETGFPSDVEAIMINKCATAGCHNDLSKIGASNLSLTSWDNMFKGNTIGAVVVPYSPNQSPLLAFVNTYTEYGISLLPTMPVNASILSKQEVKLLRDWIIQGAPNNKGYVAFSDNPTGRSKFYITNQGCDNLSVFDASTGLIMRYIDIGLNPNSIEAPHMIRISPDKKYIYVAFFASPIIQKISTITDDVVGSLQITTDGGSWGTLCISADGKRAVLADWTSSGRIAIIDIENMQVLKIYKGTNLFLYPHGVGINNTGTTLYVTAQTGNFIYKIGISNLDFPDIQELVLQPGMPKNTSTSLDPHHIEFSADYSKYFITCQASNELRVFQSTNDSLLAVIPTGQYPQEIAIAKNKPYLFVSCMEDTTQSGSRGAIAVINYESNSLVKLIYGFQQPHGLDVNNAHNRLYVANRNKNPNGPAPHHSTLCGGRNGYIQAIDMNTLEIISSYKPEVTVDPYSLVSKE